LSTSAPVDAVGLPTGVASLALGEAHACALTDSGGVKCWGRNDRGQLGDGSTTDRPAPADVLGLTSGVSALALGVRHTCALTDVGGVACWGDNANGQLGDGSGISRDAPSDVVGLTAGVTSLRAAALHTCALTGAGGVTCWGVNVDGQLGDGSRFDRGEPVFAQTLTAGVASVALSDNRTCVVTTQGAVRCWGDNSQGQLGDTTRDDSNTPVNALDLTAGMSSVATTLSNTCAVSRGGGLTCWGGNRQGQVGDGSTTNRLAPTDVLGLTSGVASLALGVGHACALTASGEVLCWGANDRGQAGIGFVSPPVTTPSRLYRD
jgi:alpha-tubulin suppressor-like RCC1 family protein